MTTTHNLDRFEKARERITANDTAARRESEFECYRKSTMDTSNGYYCKAILKTGNHATCGCRNRAKADGLCGTHREKKG